MQISAKTPVHSPEDPNNSHHLPSSLEDSQPVLDTPQLCGIPIQGDFVHH